METSRQPDGTLVLRMTEAEAVVLHFRIALSEFEDDLDGIELPEPVDKKVFSDVQQSLAQWIPGLGTDEYQRVIDSAYVAIDPSPYR